MPENEFIGTLVTTNVGFFSSVAFSTVLVVTMGIGPALLAVLAWCIGLFWFALYLPNLLVFFRKGSTVHEYIGAMYGRTPAQQRHLRFYSSTITFLLYIASVGAEIKFTSDVFAGPTGLSTAWLALVMSIAGVFYVSIAGYRGVVSTDRLRFWAILAGVGALYFFIFREAATSHLTFPASYFSLKMLTIGPSFSSLLSLVILLCLYQFCVMDMWERCIAVVNSNFDAGRSPKSCDEAAIKSMRRMIIGSIIPFAVLFGAWYGIGLLSLGQHWTDDPNQIVPELIRRLQAYSFSSLSGAFVNTLAVLCFSAAALSTIDGFIVAAVQTIVYDWLPAFRKTHAESTELSIPDAKRTLLWSRLLVIIVGAIAVGIAYSSFAIMSFWVGMYSLMLSFFPAIFLSLVHSRVVAEPSAARVALSIVAGALTALLSALLGTYVVPQYQLLTILPPFLAVGTSSLVLLPSVRLSPNATRQ